MLKLYALFHCNLASSAIPREEFPLVIERCYRPILDLAEQGLRVAIEMSAWTLLEVLKLEPDFIKRLKALWEDGKCEFVGSGYSQAVFPLIPAEVNRWNLDAGNSHYKRVLGRTPATALINEQTFSKGLVDLYREAGYRTIIMDWNTCSRFNRYPNDYRFFPQITNGFKGEINVLWSDNIALRKFRMCVHGEIPEGEYIDYLFSRSRGGGDRAFVLYCGEAEEFDYRPHADFIPNGEFVRIRRLLERASKDGRTGLCTPGELTEGFKESAGAFNTVSLDSVETPVVSGKLEQCTPVGWAVAGRDSAHINTECYRVYNDIKSIIKEGLATAAEIESFKETLCLVWGSDFRVQTIDEKFIYFRNRLGWLTLSTGEVLEKNAVRGVELPMAVGDGEYAGGCANPEGCCGKTVEVHECSCAGAVEKQGAEITTTGRTLRIKTVAVDVEFLVNKGLAIKSAAFPEVCEKPLIGTLPNGYYDDNKSLGEDFFSGHLMHQAINGVKTDDLIDAIPAIEESKDEVTVKVKLPLPIGTLWKVYRVDKTSPQLKLTYRLRVDRLKASSLRLGIFTFIPDALESDKLWFESVNGGTGVERFYLSGREIRHDEPVTRRETAGGCIGATDGIVRVGDEEKYIKITTDKSKLYSVPMLRYVCPDKIFFFRLYHTIGETDDTASWVWSGYKEISFTLSAGRTGPVDRVRKIWEYRGKQ